MGDYPPWLKSMQNGTIGEARSRAFLLDRFWILERSVDIHGVDFIIQRRLHGSDILDTTPPRFGVVQSKFAQDERTCHEIKREFVLDDDSHPRKEAFLLMHTGDEETQQTFLLTSDDIFSDFPLRGDKFAIRAGRVFSSWKYRVTNRKHTLDRIERAIRCVQFYKNRTFLFSRLYSEEPDYGAVLPVYQEDINSRFGSIPELFERQKREAFELMLRTQDLHERLRRFVESVDPIEASTIAERLHHDFGRSLSIIELPYKDLFYSARGLKERVESLRSDGALDNYILMRDHMATSANEFLRSLAPSEISEGVIHLFAVSYDPGDLSFRDATSSICNEREGELKGEFARIVEAGEGRVALLWRFGM